MTASRANRRAGAGEFGSLWVISTARDMMLGASVVFADVGQRELEASTAPGGSTASNAELACRRATPPVDANDRGGRQSGMHMHDTGRDGPVLKTVPVLRSDSRTPKPRAPVTVQRKLIVGAADDPAEHEADDIADRIVRASTRPSAGAAPLADVVGRIRRAPSGAVGRSGGHLDDETSGRIARASTGGRPLARSVEQRFEQALGADVSLVRLHAGAEATALNERISARAFTSGRDIFFRDGVPDPGRSDELHLLAHEVAHTVQNGAAKVRAAHIRRFTEPVVGRRTSDSGDLHVYLKGKFMLMPRTALDEANRRLDELGALVLLVERTDLGDLGVAVQPGINAATVLGMGDPEWKRMKARQPDRSYRSFADCFRTSATVSGLDASGRKPSVLHLATGDVDVMTALQATEAKVGSSLAARAAASFFDHALPNFLEHLNGRPPDSWSTSPVKAALERYARLSGASRAAGGPVAYKAILADPVLAPTFTERFGINSSMAPEIGMALTQVNDPVEKDLATTDKWNFHWAGVVATSGTDYVTLENLACEIDDATQAEIVANADIFKDQTARTMASGKFTKQDLINDRWFFKMYGADNTSFHQQSLNDSHATPSAITLPLGKKMPTD